MSLEGKVAIVTGSARGLGRDYARSFAKEGVSVVIADLLAEQAQSTAAEISQAGGRAIAVGVDVADPASTLAMAEAAAGAFGRIDILVNNAALWGDLQSKPLLATEPDYWDKVLAVNLKGPLLCAQAVVPHMKKNRWGRIVNISSMGALMRGGAYGVSKLGLNHITFSLAHELGEFGITVNGVGPGSTYNEATQKQVPEAAFNHLVNQQAIKRGGTSADQYGAIRYLCSDAAEWFTGQTMYVNGGFNVSF
jgi:NAD(P)-dependent dehydrogenase (short-subunit alcohol dehydrogenase family)